MLLVPISWALALYWWMWWRWKYETTHLNKWCSHTLRSVETRNIVVESGIRISRLKTQFAVTPGYDGNNIIRSRSTIKYLYPMKCLNLQTANTKQIRLSSSANLFANGSAVDHYPGWLVRVTVMVMVVITVAIRGFACQRLTTTPTQWTGSGGMRIEDGKITGCELNSSWSAKAWGYEIMNISMGASVKTKTW